MRVSFGAVVYLYELADRLFNPLQSLFLFLVRLYWGWLFVRTGYGKLLNLERTSDFFATLGMPFPHPPFKSGRFPERPSLFFPLYIPCGLSVWGGRLFP